MARSIFQNARGFCFNTWKQFSRINRELCYTLCIIEHDTVQTFVLRSQTNRIMGSTRLGIENFNGKQDRYIFIERILEALELSRLDVCFPFEELWLLKLSNICTHQHMRNYRATLLPPSSHAPLLLLFLLTYRIFLDSFINAWTKYRTYSLVDPSPIEIFIFVYRARFLEMNSKFRNPSPYMRYPSNIPYLCIQILNPLFQACKLMHTQNDKFPDHFTRGWVAHPPQVKSDWRCFFHTLISDTRRVRCVRKMPDLNLRYGSRKYFNPSHFYVTCITDRASLYYFARWNLFWKYTYMLFFFLNSVTVRNYGKMYEISS